jgi:hypothetical protein
VTVSEQKLMAELGRLYAPGGEPLPAASPVSLLAADGASRAIALAFDKLPGADAMQPWTELCLVANTMQTELGLPPPAVSISGLNGYVLWLSLAAAAPAAQIAAFVAHVQRSCCPQTELRNLAAGSAMALPPFVHPDTGRWAAFINPGLGASFSEEFGLDMPPPVVAQAALLQGLHSISAEQFGQALARPQPAANAPALVAPAPGVAADAGVLLSDATLEQIVAHLHARGIEPTFRYPLAS